MGRKGKDGCTYSQTYLRTVCNQLSALFNHAVRYYGLRENSLLKAGKMGAEKGGEMLYWTRDEYERFSEAMMDKPLSHLAFEVLYWTGIHEGELLELTPADFDLKGNILSITKSYQRLEGKDVVTSPKTPKSMRKVTMPRFLSEEVGDYLKMDGRAVRRSQRMFAVSESYLYHEMDRGRAESGVKRICVHGIRHSHVSLLIELGYSVTAIADRMGHESIDIIYRYAHLFPDKQTELADVHGGLRGGEAL